MNAQEIVFVPFRLALNDINIREPTPVGHTEDINAYLAVASEAQWFSADVPWARLPDGTKLLMNRASGDVACPQPS